VPVKRSVAKKAVAKKAVAKKAVAKTAAPRRARVRLAVDDRRRQLLALGLRTFGEKPYDEVSTQAIAEEAGISHGLLFHYFASKHDFYVAVLQIAADELLAGVVPRQGAPAERLVAGLHAYFEFVERRAVAYGTLLRAGVGSDPVAKELVDATRERILVQMRDDLAPVIGDRVAPRIVRAALRGWFGYVEALALDWIDHRDLTREELVSLSARALESALPAELR